MPSTLDNYFIRLEPEIITRLALAVFVADDYAPNKPPVGPVKVLIKKRNLEAIKNPSGHYLFLNLPDGDYTVETETLYYIDQEINITIPRTFNNGEYILADPVNRDDKEAKLTYVTYLRDGDVLEFNKENKKPERRWITLHQDPNTPKVYWDEDVRGGLEYGYAKETVLHTPLIWQHKRLIRIDLKPNSSYPFPTGATLVRGVVQDNYGNAVSEAIIKVEMIKITIESEEPIIITKTPLEMIGEDIVTFSSDIGDFALYFQLAKFKRDKDNIDNNNINNIDIMVDLRVTHDDFQDYEIKDFKVPKEKTTPIEDIIKLQEKP